MGALLLALAGSYYGYTLFAARNFDGLASRSPAGADTLPAPLTPPSAQAESPPPALQQLYPGALVPARQWADARGYEGLRAALPEGFAPVSDIGRPSIGGSIGRADRIRIPALGVEASVEELAIVRLADSAAYETPKFTVGHIPDTPNPGSHGNGWYFGHLESPLQGEGNVFARLPRVPELLRAGEDVHIILQSGDNEYLYLVSETDLVHQDDISVYQAGDARVTLVTCFPRLKYDQRLLVTAQLIGFREVGAV